MGRRENGCGMAAVELKKFEIPFHHTYVREVLNGCNCFTDPG